MGQYLYGTARLFARILLWYRAPEGPSGRSWAPSADVHLTSQRPRGIALATTAAVLILLGAGCFGNEKTPFPEGLEPLEAGDPELPEPTADQPFPEVLNMQTGNDGDLVWVHARGYVRRPLADVYLAMHTAEVCVDHAAVDRHRIEHDVEPEYDYSFRIHNEVDDVITVEFDVVWRFGTVEGTEDEPQVVAGAFQKVWGTTFISIMRGSVVARRVEDGVTEIELIEHLEAASGGVDAIRQYIEDLFANIVEVSHGRPLPEY